MLINTNKKPISFCDACEDLAYKMYKGKFYCTECYEEVAKGKIKNQNIHFVGSQHMLRDDYDDQHSWQENAIRDMEG